MPKTSVSTSVGKITKTVTTSGPHFSGQKLAANVRYIIRLVKPKNEI